MTTSVTLKAPGHIHTDRSRERRSNSGKSDDSTYPKIKTPSREDTITGTTIIDEDLKKTLDTPNTEVQKNKDLKKYRKKRHLIPPERKKRRQSQLSEDSHIYQNISQRTELHSTCQDEHHPSVQVTPVSKSKPKRSTSSPDLRKIEDLHEGSGTNIKRSISITLPNKLNHKIRKRINTVGVDGQDNHELRIRSSKLNSSKTQHDEHEKKYRNRKYSDFEGHQSFLNQRAPKSIPHETHEPPETSNLRKKHYSSFQNTNTTTLEHNSNLQDLLFHFTEIEKRNKVRREKHQSSKKLPGISELVRRHEDLRNVNLLQYIKDSTSAQTVAPKKDRQRRSDKRKEYVVSQVLPPSEEKMKRAKSFDDDQAYSISKRKMNTRRNRKKEEEILDEQFSKMKIGSIYNTGVPENHCSISTVTLSQSDSDRMSDKTVSPEIEKELPFQKPPMKEVLIKDTRPITINRSKGQKHFANKRASRHYIEYTKVDGSQINKGCKSKAVQKVEVVPRPNQEVELGIKIQKRKTRERHFTREHDITETLYAHDTKRQRDRSISKRLSQRAEHHVKPTPKYSQTQEDVTVMEADTDEGDDASVNNNIVKMLKKIDKQSLKKRLSIDKLDSFDTDDESHLDRMLESITAFVEGKIKRRRCKTNGGIRFGPSTVHVYDPMVITEPFDERKHVNELNGILKKRT